MSIPSPDSFDYPLFSLDHAGVWIDATQPRLLLNLPSEGELIANVSVAWRGEPRGKLEPMVAGALQQLQRDTTMEALEIDPVEDLEVDGMPAKLVSFTFAVPLPAPEGARLGRSPRMRCAQVHLLREGIGFLITFTAEADAFAEAEMHFRTLLASLRFRAPG